MLLMLLAAALAAGSSAGRLEQLAYSHSSAYASAAASASSSASAGASSYSGVGAPFRYENHVNNGDGTYRYSYDTNNGISAHESGAPRAAGPSGPAVTAEGGYSYRAPDGQQVSLTYTADENGFHPVGSHLPTPPPIPEAILRSIEYNRQHPSDDGAYNPARYSY